MTAPELLPGDRTWPPETERIAQALCDLLNGGGTYTAALYLLMRCPGQPWATQQVLDAAIDHGWAGLCANPDVTGHRLTNEQAAVMDLVASLAGEYEVDLAASLSRLSSEMRRVFADALMLGGAG